MYRYYEKNIIITEQTLLHSFFLLFVKNINIVFIDIKKKDTGKGEISIKLEWSECPTT